MPLPRWRSGGAGPPHKEVSRVVLQRSTSVRRWATAASIVCLTACGAPKSHPVDQPIRYQAGLLAPRERLAAGAISVMQNVRGKQGLDDIAFQCAVRLSSGKLTIHGTTLHRPRAFVIQQDGVHVQADGASLRDVPFEPVHVLYDIHRVFFRGLQVAQPDGVHDRIEDDELVRELWRDGHLVERTFHSLDTFSKLVIIHFEGAPTPVVAPRVHLVNVHHGYSLLIENIRQERLDGAGYTLHVEKGALANP